MQQYSTARARGSIQGNAQLMPLRSCASPLCSGVAWVLNGSWPLLLVRGALAASISRVLCGFLLCRSFPRFAPPPVWWPPATPSVYHAIMKRHNVCKQETPPAQL